jgi:hypothetical protein|tara:strand:- start:432 stop:929 length:498 start_codon:yes stop_codon:yes gene_type:complete
MKKAIVVIILGLMLSECSENKSEANRKQSTIKLSCEIKKVHIIKKFDGTDMGVWYDEKFLKENLSQLTEPIIIEIFKKDSLAMWQDKQPVLLNDHNEKGFSYLNESATQKKGFINLHYISVNYDNLEYKAETSILIKDDDSKYNFGFSNKAEISSIGYGSCEKLK